MAIIDRSAGMQMTHNSKEMHTSEGKETGRLLIKGAVSLLLKFAIIAVLMTKK